MAQSWLRTLQNHCIQCFLFAPNSQMLETSGFHGSESEGLGWCGRQSFTSLSLLGAAETKGRDVTLIVLQSCSDGEIFKTSPTIEKHLWPETEFCLQAEIISENCVRQSPTEENMEHVDRFHLETLKLNLV